MLLKDIVKSALLIAILALIGCEFSTSDNLVEEEVQDTTMLPQNIQRIIIEDDLIPVDSVQYE